VQWVFRFIEEVEVVFHVMSSSMNLVPESGR